MELGEVKEVLRFLRGCYPMEFRGMSTDNADAMLCAWVNLFANEAFSMEAVLDAAKRHVMGERGRAFPTPRDILEQMEVH